MSYKKAKIKKILYTSTSECYAGTIESFGYKVPTPEEIPFFIKYGYIWFYSGFPQRGLRYDLMKQTWDAIKGNYK